MLEETALVTSLDGAFAQVETLRNPACGGCQAGSACSTPLLNKYFGNRKVSVRALNPIGAAPGDKVVVGLEESALSQASVRFYLVPILMLIGFAGFGQWLAERSSLVSTEPASVFAGLLGLLMGLMWTRYHTVRINSCKRSQLVILRLANTHSSWRFASKNLSL